MIAVAREKDETVKVRLAESVPSQQRVLCFALIDYLNFGSIRDRVAARETRFLS